MHVRVRFVGKPDTIVVLESKLTKIEKLRRVLEDKFSVATKLQRLFYGGKLLEDGYTLHDYNIKLNDVIQVIEQFQPKNEETKTSNKDTEKENDSKVEYKDAESVLYTVGDLIDMRDREQGAWFEGKIVRIVYDPNVLPNKNSSSETETIVKDSKNNFMDVHKADDVSNTDDDLENKPPQDINGENSNEKLKKISEEPKKCIAKYFARSPNREKKKKEVSTTVNQIEKVHENLLYKIQLDDDESDTNMYCKLNEIRPRARTVIDVGDLKRGQKVMLNHNTEVATETGYWYDFKITDIEKLRKSYKLIGTIYLGPLAVPQNDTRVNVRENIYAIEEPVPLTERTEEYNTRMKTIPEKRTRPLNCLKCRDDEDAKCKECGCFICSGKENPDKIVLCDECNNGFHMDCLSPPMTSLPEEDWYCPSCRRDPNEVIAPGAAKQTKKTSTKSSRDWGRGMACAGKTKTCAMPANHFGPIPGIEVGMCWRFRIQLSESGVHRPPVSGIHGRDVDGAYSIVLSGGYEDDVDYGNEFTYTGSGGRDLSGNKRTAEQSCDQTLTRENKALARNCAVKKISEEGGDAGENWREGKPVRVVRSYKMLKHFPKYAPKEGIRYDGIYKVVKFYPEEGKSGYRVWKYLLRRDDPNPAPWESGAKEFPIVYPDGYLEAEAEKKAQKLKMSKGKGTTKASKKRSLRSNSSKTDTDDEVPPPTKRVKVATEKEKKNGKVTKSISPKTPKSKNQSISDFFTKTPPKTSPKPKPVETKLSDTELEAIKADTTNAKLWEECLIVGETHGKAQLVEHVTQVFLCIICQEVAVCPVTTPCLHNFCLGCIKQAFKVTGSLVCPCCRTNLSNYKPEQNEQLTTALRSIMAGYDAGKR